MLNIQQIFREVLQGNLSIVRLSWLASVEHPKGKNEKNKSIPSESGMVAKEFYIEMDKKSEWRIVESFRAI